VLAFALADRRAADLRAGKFTQIAGKGCSARNRGALAASR
jgi:hypothetical protein